MNNTPISFIDALEILKKWQSLSSDLFFMLSLRSYAIKSEGHITEIQQAVTFSWGQYGFLAAPYADAVFTRIDPSDSSFVIGLSIDYASGDKLVVFELSSDVFPAFLEV